MPSRADSRRKDPAGRDAGGARSMPVMHGPAEQGPTNDKVLVLSKLGSVAWTTREAQRRTLRVVIRQHGRRVRYRLTREAPTTGRGVPFRQPAAHEPPRAADR